MEYLTLMFTFALFTCQSCKSTWSTKQCCCFCLVLLFGP